MAKLVVSDNVSLDGVIQDPAGDEGLRVGGWVGPLKDRPELSKLTLDEALGLEAVLLGRRSYEWFAARWRSRSGELADRMNSLPKYVVSSTLEDPDWGPSTVLKSDVVNEVSKLKQELPGEIVVWASFQLVRALMQHDLVDELRLKIFPVVLGGRRAPLRRDQRQETHAPRGHPDRRGRRRLPHLRARPRRLAAPQSAARVQRFRRGTRAGTSPDMEHRSLIGEPAAVERDESAPAWASAYNVEGSG